MSGDEIWDPGLQLERTTLAWRRTALVGFGLGLTVPRLAWSTIGGWSVLLACIVAAGALALLVGAGLRYTRARHVLLAGRGQLPDGRLVLLACVLAVALAACGALIVLAHRFA